MVSLHFVCYLLECPSIEKEILLYQLNRTEAQMSERKRDLKMAPKMALDFDEVCVQSHAFISRLCFERHGVYIPAHVYRYPDWEKPPITEEEHRNIVFHHRTPPLEWAEKIELMPGALEGIDTLLACGVDIEILTARGLHEGEIETVTHVLEKYGIPLPVVGTAYRAKVNFLDGHRVVLDDQIHELEPMPEDVHRLLFSRPQNTSVWQDPKKGIVPVRDWPHAVETIKELLNL